MRKALSTFLALLLWCNLAVAAITVEGSGSAGVIGGTSGSFSVQCGSNPNRFLFVGAYFYSAIAVFSTLTYNGVSLLPVIESSPQVVIAKLVAPASGSNTLSFVSDASNNFAVAAVCVSDIDQSTPYGTLVAADALTVDVTVATDGMAIDLMAYAGSVGIPDGPYIPGAGQTERVQQDNGDGSLAVAISTEAASGTVTMSWTDDPVSCCVNRIVALPLNKVVATPGGTFFPRRRL